MNILRRWYRKPYTDAGWAIFCIRRNFLMRLFRSRGPGYVSRLPAIDRLTK